MTISGKLRLIKWLHTAIWVFYNLVILYMLYAVIVNDLHKWFWVGFGFVLLEGLILLLFGWTCPLTLLARRYSNSKQDNFDIYLPNWLARHTKTIYTSLAMLIIVIAAIRVIQKYMA
jgi:energy-coupling factor transporter transmembrane protein EcfT